MKRSFLIDLRKEFRPELIFEDEEIIARLENHPMAIWKMGQ